MTTDITNITSAAITLLVAIITTFLIPWLKTKLDVEKFNRVKEWTKVAVDAAEMIYAGTGRGEEKKAYVVEYLANKGYVLDYESLNCLIEAAVLELNRA